MNPATPPSVIAGRRPAATAIYVVMSGQGTVPHVSLAITRLRALADELTVVAAPADEAALRAALPPTALPDRFLRFSGGIATPLAGFRNALAVLRGDGPESGPMILSASNVFGPTGDPAPWIATMADNGADLYAPYWQAAELEPRLARKCGAARVAHLDFAVFGPRLLAHDGFWAFWEAFRPSGDPWSEFLAGPVAFSTWMQAEGLITRYPMAKGRLESANPCLTEVHKLVEDGVPCIPVAVFTLDPLVHDLNAIYLREALDGLRAADPELYAAVIGFVSREVPLRNFNTAADQYEVLSCTAASPAKRSWEFGTVAVFIHVYYTAMMPEFWELAQRLPCARHLFLTAAGEAEKAEIETFLSGKGLGRDDFTVRAVEQNRGRDMSSLFITWRDIVLNGNYEIALRLHSKRTPQVDRQVAENFKKHLFDNLLASPGYVANLLDRLEAEPDIGLAIPPAIHIGFDTLGHSWFNNKAPLHELCLEMGIEVPLDEFTPVAPYGTMYWFRTDALRAMFERNWPWKSYNIEPHHIDGGLAHVQERLIGYAAQGRGYRVLTVMTPRQAARNYAKLEYKMQYLTGHLMTGHILNQTAQLRAATGWRVRLFRAMQQHYGRALIRYPGLRGPLRPAKHLVVALLAGRRKVP